MATLAFSPDRPIPPPAWLKRPGIRTIELTEEESTLLRGLLGSDAGRMERDHVERLAARVASLPRLSGLHALATSIGRGLEPVHVRLD
jgi:hypothetical protein